MVGINFNIYYLAFWLILLVGTIDNFKCIMISAVLYYGAPFNYDLIMPGM